MKPERPERGLFDVFDVRGYYTVTAVECHDGGILRVHDMKWDSAESVVFFSGNQISGFSYTLFHNRGTRDQFLPPAPWLSPIVLSPELQAISNRLIRGPFFFLQEP